MNSLEHYAEAVQWRWLLPEEVHDILTNHDSLGCTISQSPPDCPPSGCVFLYDRRKCKRFRRDGHNWVTRKSAGRIREDHVKLRVNGVQSVAAAHAHSADVAAFHRRTYHLLVEDSWLSLVHYRACEAREEGSRKIRRDVGRAQQLAAEQVEQAIACADLDVRCSLDDQLLADAVQELFGNSGPDVKVAQGAVDALTGLPVPSVKLEKIEPAAPCARVADVAPLHFRLGASERERRCLIALDKPVEAGDQLAVRFAFADDDVEDAEAYVVNACTLRCVAPQRAAATRASVQLVAPDGAISVGPALTWGDSPPETDVVRDDDTLAKMPEAELDQAVEKLVLKVLSQMSKIARTNTDLADELDKPDRHGFSLLHYCALYNLSSVIAELLSLGAHPDGRTSTTPLHLAAGAGHANVVTALLDGGACPRILDASGQTPSDRAVRRGHADVASMLDDYHADELRVSPRTRHSTVAEMSSIKRCRREPMPPSESQQFEDGAPCALDLNKALLDTAFESLSLHERCALSMANGNNDAPCDPDTQDQESSVDVAMSLMGETEIHELEDEARVITANVRSWIVRRKYVKVREAARTLETRFYLRKKSSSFSDTNKAAHKLQAASRGMLERKKLSHVKEQMLALLVISRNFRGRLSFKH